MSAARSTKAAISGSMGTLVHLYIAGIPPSMTEIDSGCESRHAARGFGERAGGGRLPADAPVLDDGVRLGGGAFAGGQSTGRPAALSLGNRLPPWPRGAPPRRPC